MVTFKGVWGKLYYTQHTLLSNVRQLPPFFFGETNTHTQVRGKMGSNTKAHHNSTQKSWKLLREGGVSYTTHNTLF